MTTIGGVSFAAPRNVRAQTWANKNAPDFSEAFDVVRLL
jgi:hypothetical protein